VEEGPDKKNTDSAPVKTQPQRPGLHRFMDSIKHGLIDLFKEEEDILK
jgi:hypothetical protein